MILNGEWKPGVKIPSESDLTELFQVSRIAIREALKKLLALSLIETRPGSGTYVKEFSAGLYANSFVPLLILNRLNTVHVIEFRSALEIENVKLAAERAADSNVETLQNILEEMEKAVGDSKRYANLDADFHCEIARMTGNPLIMNVMLLLKEIMASAMTDTTATLGYDSFPKHKEIFEAIKSRNAQLARRLMRSHFQHTLAKLKTAGL